MSPEEVLESVKHFFSQGRVYSYAAECDALVVSSTMVFLEYEPNPNEKLNWKKLFNSVEPVPSAIKVDFAIRISRVN